MKRNIRLSIALALSVVLLSLIKSDSPARAENQLRYVAGTGVITPGDNQNLSLTVDGGAGNDAIALRFRRTRYVKTDCINGVCRYVVDSQTTSPTMISAPNQSSKLDVIGTTIGPDAAVSIEVFISSRNARATVQLTDALTGRADSVLIALINGLPGVN